VSVASLVALPKYNDLGEIASKIFRVLPHSPVTRVELTRAVHATLGPEGKWADLSRALVREDAWLPLGDQPHLDSVTLTAERGEQDDFAGTVAVTVEPSQEAPDSAYIAATNTVEFEFNDPGEFPTAEPAIQVIEKRWKDWLTEAEQLIDYIRGKAGE
jgi:hypothetical protein